MDVYDILGDRIDAGAIALINSHVESAVAVRRYNLVREKCVFQYFRPTWKEFFDDMTGNALRFVNILEKYRKEDPATRTPPKVTRWDSVSMETILDLPIVASELLCRSKVPYAYCGTTLCNEGLFVLSLAHFYTYARKCGRVPVWEDMELVISQNPSFVIPTSDDADAYAAVRHFRFALGIPASKVFHNAFSALPGPHQIQAKAKRVQVTAALFKTLATHHRNAALSVLPTAGLFDSVLNTLADASAVEAEKANTSGTKRNNGSRRMFSPLELLETMKEHFIASEVQLNFDYVSFFRVCIEITSALTRLGYPGLASDTPTPSIPSYDMVDVLLRESADTVAASRPLAATAFARAAAVLKTFIVEEGGVLKQAAFEKSSGHIPEHMRPTRVNQKNCRSEARVSLEGKGFRFDGPQCNAAIYLPTFETAAIMEDVVLVNARLLERAETCSEAQEVSEEEDTGEIGKKIGMHRWRDAMDLIKLHEEHNSSK
ncbi:hypothetical protein LTR56_024324 [Elasticomyces elasticus]|nr:hypothetical protein LTR56_024324 [Elasticomyces elasticus]KAK3646909.1 hypothetical protein LTR22_014062 [Elasticomyces elasticus]KAK4905805.1 hypothetical protein LTR49_024945 [Elasticomyces elasticus]